MGENKDVGANGRWQYSTLYDPFWSVQPGSKSQAAPSRQSHHVGDISCHGLVGMGVCEGVHGVLQRHVALSRCSSRKVVKPFPSAHRKKISHPKASAQAVERAAQQADGEEELF